MNHEAHFLTFELGRAFLKGSATYLEKKCKQVIMGIDHGLGGKDTLKSKLRREKKAKRIKNIAKKLQSEDVPRSTKEVKFDEAARVAWLTGFRKRKQERRKYGLAMQILKDKKARKDLVKEKRKGLKSHSDELEKVLQSLEDEKEKDTADHAETVIEQEEVFEDEATRAMFGSSVSVSIQSNLDDQWFGSKAKYLSDEYTQPSDGDEADSHSVAKSSTSRAPSSSGRKPETKLERALKQAKVLMATKKKKPSDLRHVKNRDVKSKIEASRLMDKAFGNKGKGRGNKVGRGGSGKKGRR
eukprot:gene36261-43988_t